MNSFLLLCDVFSFVFWKKLKTPKRNFEIIWPLLYLLQFLMNQSLVVYWTKIGTFWPWCPRESFIILGSQIVPDNNHVVPCHVIICSGQSRRYCVKLEKVDNIGSTNLIITRGSRLQQKENKWWSVFSIFQSSASRVSWGLCFASVFGVLAWDVCLRSPLGSLLLDLCSQVSASHLSTAVARRKKKSKHFVFNKYFSLVLKVS